MNLYRAARSSALAAFTTPLLSLTTSGTFSMTVLVPVFVVGTRGDAEVWLCTVIGPEAIDLPAGPVPDALHLRRAPRRLYDTTVDVWLDPARHHLPVRVQLLVRPTGQETTLLLESADLP